MNDKTKRTFNQLSQSGVYKEDDIAVTLTVCGGTYGGGSEVLVVEEYNDNKIAISFQERAGKPGGVKEY